MNHSDAFMIIMIAKHIDNERYFWIFSAIFAVSLISYRFIQAEVRNRRNAARTAKVGARSRRNAARPSAPRASSARRPGSSPKIRLADSRGASQNAEAKHPIRASADRGCPPRDAEQAC